jgi:phospholipase C
MNTLTQKTTAPCIVHTFITYQGINILRDDMGNKINVNLLRLNEVILKGNIWCDEGFKNVHHFYHPKTKKGIMGLMGADILLEEYLRKIIDSYSSANLQNCFFNIGSALHLIQDLCVPHHALGHLLKGHHEYETWVTKYYKRFKVDEGGLYNFKSPMDIFFHNASKAIEYEDVVENSSERNKVEATKDLLGLAQRTTASFIYLILKKFNI